MYAGKSDVGTDPDCPFTGRHPKIQSSINVPDTEHDNRWHY
jgi:hypothetical protein